MYFQLKPLSSSGVPIAAVGLASSVATDLVLPLLVPQRASGSLGSGGNEECEEEVLAALVDQVTPVFTKR